MHYHYCKIQRHRWSCQAPEGFERCGYPRVYTCEDCQRQLTSTAGWIVPIICERCGTWKRAADGRALYVSGEWRKGKRMVCPDCLGAEQTMEALETVVWGNDDDEIPF